MNKEVIYLEPEDDITDILTRLQQAEQKLVALVPPKKATVLRSAVNMKLVARVAKECDKVAVIVTADPAIIKMAMAAKVPVARTLQSRPTIPSEEDLRDVESEDQILDENLEDVTDQQDHKDNAKTASKGSSVDSGARSVKSADTLELTDESLENGSKDAKKGSKKAKDAKKAEKTTDGSKFAKYRKFIVPGIVLVLVLVVVGVWAFVFAPAATIAVRISSTASNFSEPVRFTTDANAANAADGLLFAEKQSVERNYTTSFTATGEEDRGTKATGTLSVTYSMRMRDFAGEGFTIGVSEGEIFSTTSGLEYRVTESTPAVSWNGNDFPFNDCNTPVSKYNGTCVKTFNVPVEAVRAGEEYNISTTVSWNSFEGAAVANSGAISGGTTKMVKVVSQSDVDKIKEELLKENEEKGKTELFEDMSKELLPLRESFTAEVTKVESTPGVGDEVGSNTTPNVKVTVVFSAYAVRESNIEEYIKAKTNLASDQKIYSYGAPYFERFSSLEDVARIKTTIEVGPTVTEEDVFERTKGRKTGEVKSILQSITGVSSVEVRTPYFWVWSIPTERDRVTIDLNVEER